MALPVVCSESSIISSTACRSMRFYACMLSIAALLYAAFIFRTSFAVGQETYYTLVDDAMISMRYARNLADGHGITWNIGEKSVQGYTNFGWMLYMTLLHLIQLPTSKTSLLLMITNVVCLILNVLTAKRIAELMTPNGWIAPALASTVVAFYFPLVYWSLRGMEVGLLSLLISTATFLALRLRDGFEWKLTAALALILTVSVFVRIDAALQASVLAGFVVICSFRNRRYSHVALIGLVLVAAMILLYLFQTSYFGKFLPNTYYLKVTGVSVLDRISVGIRTLLDYSLRDLFFLGFVIVGGLLWYSDVRSPAILLLLCLFAIQCAYSIYVGGDYVESQEIGANRFVTQGMSPLLIAFSVVSYRFLVDVKSLKRNIVHRINRRSLLLLLFLSSGTILVISGIQWRLWLTKNAHSLSSDIWRARLGALIEQGTDENAVVAAHAVGQVSYYSQRNIIDLLGKSDEFIATTPPAAPFQPGHNKWNYDYSILELQPDMIADEMTGDLRRFLETHTHAYDRLPNGIWIRRDSALVNTSVLSRDYRK